MNASVGVAAARLLTAVAIVAAIVATCIAVAPIVVQNLFGYFTIQSNVIGAVVAAVGAARLARGVAPTTAWTVVRWGAVSYLTVVGIVYWTLLAPLGAAGGVPVPWANAVLHAVSPVLALLDWFLVRDRVAMTFRLLPLALAYPLIWIAVVLVRGATDGWVPYPFLSPAQGYPVVAGWVALVAGVITGTAALLLLPARTRSARTAVA